MAKTAYVRARVSDAEKKAIDARAETLRMTTSDYLRFCASLPIEFVDGALESRADTPIAIDATTYRKLLIEARRWGSNFNQATRALNTIGRHYVNPPRGAERAEEVVRLAARAMDSMNRAKAGMDELVRIAGALEGRAAVRADIPEER